jgi:hypothetical protein
MCIFSQLNRFRIDNIEGFDVIETALAELLNQVTCRKMISTEKWLTGWKIYLLLLFLPEDAGA